MIFQVFEKDRAVTADLDLDRAGGLTLDFDFLAYNFERFPRVVVHHLVGIGRIGFFDEGIVLVVSSDG